MKTKIIYTILFAACALFCQAFGVQNELPTYRDTICATPGETIHMENFESQILEILQSREDSIWSECCDTITVNLGDVSGFVMGDKDIENKFSIWPDVKINTNKTVYVDVEYTRELVCSKIPPQGENLSPASSVMWHLFGKLLSNIDTARAVTKISEEATVKTLHKATFIFKFELSLPDIAVVPFKIKGDICFNDDGEVELSMDSAYLPYGLVWIASNGVGPSKNVNTPVEFYEKRQGGGFLYPIVCTATACKGETRSDTVFIGKPTPTPVMEDLSCVVANATSFDVKVKEPDDRLSYHWIVENKENRSRIDSVQGVEVNLKILENEQVRLRLVSKGGCRDAEMEPKIVYRSLVPGFHKIALNTDALCVFEGDSVSFSLPEAPESSLVWKIDNETATLSANEKYCYIAPTNGEKRITVFAEGCPNDTISNTFTIREAFKVSLDANPSCVRAYAGNVFRLSCNGINPEVHWYGNGVEIDTATYSKKDSILLRLTNPGGQNLYVAVKTRECGKERKDSIPLRPLPEKPSWDTLWNGCIPLGIADTIELRVQPQEGVKFKWQPEEEAGKFWQIGQSDSNSTLVVVNYELGERGKSASVSVSATVDGCGDSEPMTEVLYATGAGLDEEWALVQNEGFLGFYSVGFSDDGENIKYDGFEYPFDEEYIMLWSPMEGEYFCSVDPEEIPLVLSCKLTSVERQCYSVYSIEVVDMQDPQDVLFVTKKGGEDVGCGKETESLQEKATFANEVMPCSGIVLHPNPAHSDVYVKVEGICETESFTIECYSPQGRLMFRQKAKGDSFSFPTDNYAAGVYIVKIQLEGETFPIVKKLIIL
ncbi:MAG: T9SS type A sorting domain-containing protein [Bacteroides sp.]|nr:T9SS type A sorting domain-containing protein [Bacteroides sp.]